MAPGQHAPHPFVGLAFLVLVQLSLFIGITVFTVQLPDIMRDLNIQQGTAEMTITIYLALPPALLVTMGQLADRRGRRRVLFIGAAVMIASSLLGGISWNGEILILARLLQGIAYAMLLTTAVALINVMFTEPRDRGIAFGMLAASLGVGFSVGPLLGGFSLKNGRGVGRFFFNIPVMLLVVIGSWWSVPESKSTRQTGPLDLPGTALLGTGLLSLVVALSQGRTYGWLRPHESFGVAGWHWPYSFSFVSLLLAAAVILLILFVSYERSRTRWTQSVLMDFELFRAAAVYRRVRHQLRVHSRRVSDYRSAAYLPARRVALQPNTDGVGDGRVWRGNGTVGHACRTARNTGSVCRMRPRLRSLFARASHAPRAQFLPADESALRFGTASCCVPL